MPKIQPQNSKAPIKKSQVYIIYIGDILSVGIPSRRRTNTTYLNVICSIPVQQ